MTAREQRRTTRRALRLDIEVQQLLALRAKTINPRSRRAAQHPTAITAKLTPTKVIPEKHHNIWLIGHVDSSPLLWVSDTRPPRRPSPADVDMLSSTSRTDKVAGR
jgi:hypothetical protein